MSARPTSSSATPPRNLADLVSTAAGFGDKPALLCDDRVITWRELDADVDRVAAALVSLGLAEGDRVALLLPNTPELVAGYFGILRAGLVAVPLNPSYTVTEIAHQVADSAARLLVTDAAHAEQASAVRAAAPTLETVVLADGATSADAMSWADLLARGGAAPDTSRGAEDLAVLLYTSGTSGRPKGAMLSHRALLANLDQLDRIDKAIVQPDDVVLLVLPLFHVYGLNVGLGMTAKTGATGVLTERFEPVETLDLIRRHGVTAVMGAPPMYVAWSMLPDAREAFGTVRLAVSGAAPLPPEVFETLHTGADVDIFEGYGLTETAPVLTTTLMSEAAKPGSVGRPVPGVELRLLDEAGHEVEEEDPGEIVVRGANLFSGYWPDGAGGPDNDGWFRTGDVAYADGDGDLFLVDRTRELILVSGFNVYPREVEDALVEHPDIKEAAVIGVPHPYTGETVKALVVLRPGAHLRADDVIAWAQERLARFKCPTTVQFTDALPHSATGKVAKGLLREAESAV
jgi:long-chain acyl-CoA synthetase